MRGGQRLGPGASGDHRGIGRNHAVGAADAYEALLRQIESDGAPAHEAPPIALEGTH